MGGSAWNDTFYEERAKERARTHVPTFEYTERVAKAPPEERVVHPTLSAKKADGKPVLRESRDSDAHPESLAILVSLDVTGSMHNTPKIVQRRLPALMGLLIAKGYVAHPQILSLAMGDATCDRVPFQAGQFESGVEIEDNLRSMFLEAGGGAGDQESYELPLRFAAKYTAIDCHEKRGEKGFLFLIGDERAYPTLSREIARKVFGEELAQPVPIKQLVAEASEKYHVFFVLPKEASHGNDRAIVDFWGNLLGAQNVLRLESAEGICECIAVAVGIVLGTLDHDAAEGDLREKGASAATARSVVAATSDLAKSVALARPNATGDLPVRVGGTSGSIERL